MRIENTFWIDACAVVFACFVVIFVLANLGFESSPSDVQKEFVQFSLLSFFYLSALYVFSKRERWFSLPSVIVSLFSGNLLWLLSNTIWKIFSDPTYFSFSVTGATRIVQMVETNGSIILVISLLVLLTIALTRKIYGLLFKISPKLL